MPSSEKTPNIGLNKWLPTDLPDMDDFVADNAILDAKAVILSEDGATSWDSGNFQKQSGTWDNIAIRGTTTPGNPTSGISTTAKWEIIGNEITLYFNFLLTGKGGMVGDLQIYNLPKIPTISSSGTATIGNYVSGVLPVSINATVGLGYLRVFKIGSTTHTPMQAVDIADNFQLIGATIKYKF